MEYKVFTSMLENRRKIQKSLEALRTKLEVLEYTESGVKGIDYAITPSSGNPSVKAQKRLDIVERIHEIEREITTLESMIAETESILSRMPEDLQQMLTDKFINGMTYMDLGFKYGYTDAGIYYALRRETEKYL